jgi:hypothetical protein
MGLATLAQGLPLPDELHARLHRVLDRDGHAGKSPHSLLTLAADRLGVLSPDLGAAVEVAQLSLSSRETELLAVCPGCVGKLVWITNTGGQHDKHPDGMFPPRMHT